MATTGMTGKGHPPPGHEEEEFTHHQNTKKRSPTTRRSTGSFPQRSQGPLSPLDVAEHLGVAQEPAEIDVEHVARGLEHDVVVVPVTDAQHVGGHAAAGAGVDEVFHGLRGRREGQRGRMGRKGVVPGMGDTRSRRFFLTFSYSSSLGLCFCSQSASGRSLKEPVTPCSTWIFRRVSALGIISTMPGRWDRGVRPFQPQKQ